MQTLDLNVITIDEKAKASLDFIKTLKNSKKTLN